MRAVDGVPGTGSRHGRISGSRIEAERLFRCLHVLPGSEDVALLGMGRVTIPSLDDLAATLEPVRRGGQRIVLTRGTFAVLHAGHVHFLRAARGLGDVLVVAINGDHLLSRREGRRQETIDERQRAALIVALDGVDHVIIAEEDEPVELIRRLRPAIYVKGADHAGDCLPEFDAVREIGGQVVILPRFAIASSPGEQGAPPSSVRR